MSEPIHSNCCSSIRSGPVLIHFDLIISLLNLVIELAVLRERYYWGRYWLLLATISKKRELSHPAASLRESSCYSEPFLCGMDVVLRGTADDASAIYLYSLLVPMARGRCINLLQWSSWMWGWCLVPDARPSIRRPMMICNEKQRLIITDMSTARLRSDT